MSKHDNDSIKPETSGTARLLEKNRVLDEVFRLDGENRAMFAFALSLSENSNTDYQPDDARKVKNPINTMMNCDLALHETAKFLRESENILNETLFLKEKKENS